MHIKVTPAYYHSMLGNIQVNNIKLVAFWALENEKVVSESIQYIYRKEENYKFNKICCFDLSFDLISVCQHKKCANSNIGLI